MNATLTPTMPIDDVLDEARRLGEQRYREVVIALADGQNVDAGEVNAALAAAGRTQDEIRSHLKVAYDRREAVNGDALAAESEATLATATETASKLFDEIKQAEREFNEQMAPKRIAQNEAYETSQRLQREIRQLRRDPVNTLNRTASPELHAEFRRHSDRTCRLAAAVDQAKSAAANLDARLGAADQGITDARARLSRWEAEPESEIRDEGIASAKQRLQDAVSAREELTKVSERLAQLQSEHAEAVAAMERFQTEDWTDWRQMSFD